MNLAEYREHVEAMPHGKRLPSALYVYRDETSTFGEKLDLLVRRIAQGYGADQIYNVIKFRLDELKVSFLAYPDFLEDAHPALRHAITIDLATGKHRATDYNDNLNPPILHRKEAFLPNHHPRRAEFEALTKAEESHGLYEDTTTIGFKLNWERLLVSKNLTIEGHTLYHADTRNSLVPAMRDALTIDRHKTALTRYDLSKPVKTLFEYGLLKVETSFFDYGCGQGSDIKGLRSLSYEAEGWDPVYRPDSALVSADIVNIGYVINVIEDPAERLEALCKAHSLARKLLVVSAMIQQTVDSSEASRFGDGVLTKRNTFQKFYEQQELQQFIEDALDCTAISVALGVFYVFRDPAEQQDFISARTRRSIDWNQISSRLGLGQPQPRAVRVRVDLYEKHKELLDAFWFTMLDFGRLPSPEEFSRFDELRQALRSPKNAERLFVQRGGTEALEKARENRRKDLLVYLAMSHLRKPVPFRHLSLSLKLDIRVFFGDYKRGLAQGRELLFAAGDSGEIELACEETKLGWQDEQALYIHRSVLDKLPPLLRVYVGCALLLYGDVNQADIIKLHKTSGKVTFLKYDDFGKRPLPELRLRTKVDLRNHTVQVFDHSASEQQLCFKERFVSPDYPGWAEMIAFSAELQQSGFRETSGIGPRRDQLLAFLRSSEASAVLLKQVETHGRSNRTLQQSDSFNQKA